MSVFKIELEGDKPEEITEFLKKVRKSQGHTQATMALRMGVSPSRVNKIEKYPMDVPSGLLVDYCSRLGIKSLLTFDPVEEKFRMLKKDRLKP